MSKRIYNNREIQERIASIVSELPENSLDKFCKKEHSKLIFNINFPLLLKVPSHYSYAEKIAAVKDKGGLNRWTWKFEFSKNGYSYAISTQWYERNDEYVQRWLRKIEISNS